ncbi:MAG: c-type cytochrome [Myxococcales bacterium]|nr:c-type cytochrome [Myxococcales bacterium]MCB9552000.1 c-type cytochrome [Myxococcales bacterium]
MKTWVKRGLWIGAGLAALGAAVVSSGLVSLSARAGHWEVTEQLLAFAKDRSVATHSLGVEPPVALDDPALILRGAGHYEGGCRWCHGAPGRPQPAVGQAMLPPPTDLPPFARDEPPAQLYRVIHDGIKFTGMPGWPAKDRGDEVWALVAFVKALPGMSADDYDRLVWGREAAPAGAPAVVAVACARCHGFDGRGRMAGAFPRLAGQREPYLVGALEAYASGARPSGVMGPIAVALRGDDLRAAARYYAGLDGLARKVRGFPSRATGDRLAGGSAEGEPAQAYPEVRRAWRGRAEPHGRRDRGAQQGTRALFGLGAAAEASAAGGRIVREGVPDDKIPACHGCHGPTAHDRNPAYPLLAGQDARYLREQLVLFRERRRGGSQYAELMQAVRAHGLDDAQIAAVSVWYGAAE